MARWGGLTFRKAETAAVRKNSNRMGTEEEKESWKKGDERGAGGKRNEKQIVANSSRDRDIERESAGIKARRRNGGVGRQDRKQRSCRPGGPWGPWAARGPASESWTARRVQPRSLAPLRGSPQLHARLVWPRGPRSRESCRWSLESQLPSEARVTPATCSFSSLTCVQRIWCDQGVRWEFVVSPGSILNFVFKCVLKNPVPFPLPFLHLFTCQQALTEHLLCARPLQ